MYVYDVNLLLIIFTTQYARWPKGPKHVISALIQVI